MLFEIVPEPKYDLKICLNTRNCYRTLVSSTCTSTQLLFENVQAFYADCAYFDVSNQQTDSTFFVILHIQIKLLRLKINTWC